MTAPESILVPKGRLDDAIAETRSAVARAEKAEALVAQARADFGLICRQIGDPTIGAHRTATAAIGRLQ